MYTYRYRYIIPDIMQPMLDFSAKERVKSHTHFGSKSTQNLKICLKTLKNTRLCTVFMRLAIQSS